MSAMKARLIVKAGHPAVHIEVVDRTYNVRAKGYGQLEEQLPTGLYTVRYAAGDASQEQDITLRPNEVLTIDTSPELEFASAAPLEYTWTSHEYHQYHARKLSRSAPQKYGHGGELFVFIRDLEPGGPPNLAKGLSLHRLDGQPILKFEGNVESSTDKQQARWAGVRLALDSGVYRLRLALGRRKAAEMVLTVCPGWQNQIFLLRGEPGDDTASQRVINLAGATQLMAYVEEGFNPYVNTQGGRILADEAGEDLRLAELARQALAHGRKGISTHDLQAMLNGKWHDPMLGIFGLHLLLMRPNPDLLLAERVVERLRSEILQGMRHPDVEILYAEIARLRNISIDTPLLEAPPMLRRSWQLLVKATAEQPSLIPSGSLSAQLAERLWGSGAWLMWEVPSEVPSTEKYVDIDEEVLGGNSDSNELEAQARDIPEQKLPEVISKSFEIRLLPEDEQEALKRILTSRDFQVLIKRLARPSQTSITQLATLGYSVIRAAIEALLPEVSSIIDEAGPEDLIHRAKLNATETTLLIHLATSLSTRQRSRQSSNYDPLDLSALVSKFGLPAEHVQRAMAGLFIKLTFLLMHRQ